MKKITLLLTILLLTFATISFAQVTADTPAVEVGWKTFITDNQVTIMICVLVFGFLANKFIDYKAKSNPEINNWDKIAPYSQKLYELVHKGVEHWGGASGASAIEKSDEYIKRLKMFEADWNSDKLKAVSNLIGWYLSMKQKVEKTSANPSIADTSTDK